MYKLLQMSLFCECIMLEFLFGWLVGVWMAQQLPLPKVQKMLDNWRNPPEETANTVESVEEELPLFTGEMPMPTV